MTQIFLEQFNKAEKPSGEGRTEAAERAAKLNEDTRGDIKNPPKPEPLPDTKNPEAKKMLDGFSLEDKNGESTKAGPKSDEGTKPDSPDGKKQVEKDPGGTEKAPDKSAPDLKDKSTEPDNKSPETNTKELPSPKTDNNPPPDSSTEPTPPSLSPQLDSPTGKAEIQA